MKNDSKNAADPVVWLLLIMIIPILGFGIYFISKDVVENDEISAVIDYVKGNVNSLTNANTNNVNVYAPGSKDINISSNFNTNNIIMKVNSNQNINTTTSNQLAFKWNNLNNQIELYNKDYNLNISIREIRSDIKKVFLDFKYPDGKLYSGTEVYPINTNSNVNLNSYLDIQDSYKIVDYANNLYRTHYYCDGSINESVFPRGREFIDLRSGYSNYTCFSREQEQCSSDSKFDKYYDEKCDFENVAFSEGYIKCLKNLVVTVTNITNNSIRLGIAEKTNLQSCESIKF